MFIFNKDLKLKSLVMLMGNFQSMKKREPKLYDFAWSHHAYDRDVFYRTPFEQYIAEQYQKTYGEVPKKICNIKNITIGGPGGEHGWTIELDSDYSGYAIVVVEYRLIGGNDTYGVIFKNGKGSIRVIRSRTFISEYSYVKYPGEECKVCLVTNEGMSMYKYERNDKYIRKLENNMCKRPGLTIKGKIEKDMFLDAKKNHIKVKE